MLLLSCMKKILWLLCLVCLAGQGCSDDDGGGASGQQQALSKGMTQCGSVVCQAGQYCNGAGSCFNGCTSDANCLEGRVCKDISPVTKEGTCSESTTKPTPTTPPATKDCAGFIKKCNACGGGDNCTQAACDMFSSACVSCLADTNCTDESPFEKCGCGG